jgi:hypothetical protein
MLQCCSALKIAGWSFCAPHVFFDLPEAFREHKLYSPYLS